MRSLQILVTLFLCTRMASAFAPYRGASQFGLHSQTSSPFQLTLPYQIIQHRKSVATVQTFGLFGLGPAEIAIIVVAGAFVLGPRKLGELVKSSGKMASESKDALKDIPAEFKKGMEEGEVNARSRKAKPVEQTDDE